MTMILPKAINIYENFSAMTGKPFFFELLVKGVPKAP